MSFYKDFLVGSPLFHTTSIVSSLDYLEPTFRGRIETLLEEAAAASTPLLVFETYRSRERQQKLYEQGATQLRVVGVHHYGLAVDLVKNVGGSPSWKGDFKFLRDLATKHGLVSGYDWGNPGVAHTFVDACHVQAIAVGDQPRLFDLSWYPDNQYSAYA